MDKNPRKHGTNISPKRRTRSRPHRNRPQRSLATDLLHFYDDLTALHACNAFVTQALASALFQGGGLAERASTGAVLCSQWLDDRTQELESQLSTIRARAKSPRVEPRRQGK